jgi:hypothetical protein
MRTSLEFLFLRSFARSTAWLKMERFVGTLEESG